MSIPINPLGPLVKKATPMPRRVDVSPEEIRLQKDAIPEALYEVNMMIEERDKVRERKRRAMGSTGRKRDAASLDLPPETLDELHAVREEAKAALKVTAIYYEKHWRQGKKLGCGCDACTAARPLLLINNTAVGDVVARLDAEKVVSDAVAEAEEQAKAQAALTGVPDVKVDG
jgi:hypothetical protein